MKSIPNVISPLKKGVDDRATALARARYDRIAPIYDRMPMQSKILAVGARAFSKSLSRSDHERAQSSGFADDGRQYQPAHLG